MTCLGRPDQRERTGGYGGNVERRDHAHSSVESSCSIRPACRTRRYAGEGGGAGAVHSGRRERGPEHREQRFGVCRGGVRRGGVCRGRVCEAPVGCRLGLTRRPVAPYQFFLRRVSGVPRRRPRHGQRVILSQDTAIDIRVRRTAGGLTILPTVASGSNENT